MLPGRKRTPSGSSSVGAPVTSGAPVASSAPQPDAKDLFDGISTAEEMDAAAFEATRKRTQAIAEQMAARQKAQTEAEEEQENEDFTTTMVEGWTYNEGQEDEFFVPGMMAKKTLKGRKLRRLNKPYKHQRSAALRAASRRRFMIFHDAGLGKTMTALLVRCIMHIRTGGRPMQMLVSCPKAVWQQWYDSILNTLMFGPEQVFKPESRTELEEERIVVSKHVRREIKQLQADKKKLMRGIQTPTKTEKIEAIEAKIEELQPRKIDYCDIIIVTTGLIGSCFNLCHQKTKKEKKDPVTNRWCVCLYR